MTLEHFVNSQTCAEMLKTQRAQHIATVSTHGGFAPFMPALGCKHGPCTWGGYVQTFLGDE